jgi:hypothetical protein
MLMCVGINAKGGETGRVFGEKGWMEGMRYQGTMKPLPDLRRAPLPPGVAAGGHGGSHGNLGHEFVSAIPENRPQPLSPESSAQRQAEQSSTFSVSGGWSLRTAALKETSCAGCAKILLPRGGVVVLHNRPLGCNTSETPERERPTKGEKPGPFLVGLAVNLCLWRESI